MTVSGDTIFALSSGPLPAAIAVVRVSGPGARDGLKALHVEAPAPRQAALRQLLDPAGGGVLDEALVLFFPGPASATGEDVVELHLHGGRAVVAGVLAAFGSLPGFRAAERGEFTRRGYLNGRFDLTGIEGLSDLLQAETEAQRRQALRQYGGAARDVYLDWRERIVRMRAEIEANLDFVDEEDIPQDIGADAARQASGLAAEIGRHLDDGKRGERLRDGVRVAVLGPPNAGKSSFLNALARRDVAIVTEEAGTTRDVIEVALDLGGYPMTVADTAGVREAEGLVEREGIRRAFRQAREADLVVWMWDGREAMPDLPAEIRESGVAVWQVRNKIDLAAHDPNGVIDSDAERSSFPVYSMSVKTGDGIDAVADALAGFAASVCGAGEPVLITRERHRQGLVACRAALLRAGTHGAEAMELAAEDLRSAGDALGRIVGKIDVEDLLDVIFSEFCVGK